MLLTDTQIADFQRNGAVVVRGLMADWVETMAKVIAANMADLFPYASLRFVGADARVVGRPGRTSPPFPGHDMAPADRLRPNWFPVVWSAA